MLIKLLRLAGFDLEARLAELKVETEDKAQHMLGRVKGEIRVFALRLACFLCAAILGLLGFVTGLLLLYRWLEPSLGPLAALGVVAVAVCTLGAGFALAGMALGDWKPEPRHLLFAPPATRLLPADIAPPLAVAVAVAPAHRRADAEDLVGLLGRFVPITGHWAIDGALRHFGAPIRGATQEAVARAAGLVQSGSRPAMLGVLGTGVFLGWLLVRRR